MIVDSFDEGLKQTAMTFEPSGECVTQGQSTAASARAILGSPCHAMLQSIAERAKVPPSGE